MAQRNYLINTTTISTTASGSTIGSGNTQNASFELARTLVRTGIAAGEFLSGSQTWAIHYVVSAMSTPYEMRLSLQRRNSSGTPQATIGPGTTRSATGTYDDNIVGDLGTWAANDQLALVWEHRRPSGSGNKSGTVDANGSSYIDAPADSNVAVNPTGVSATASPGTLAVAHNQGITGNALTTAVGSVAVDRAIPLTGNQITGAVGSVTFQVTNLFDSSTFAVSVDAALSTYIGQMGETWTKHPHASYAAGELNIDAASDRVWPTTTIAYYSSGVPASADYYAELDFFAASIISQNIGPCVRMDTTANTFYQLRLRDGIDWQLRKTVNDATPVTLGTSTNQIPTSGQTKRGRIVAKGDQVWAEIEGVLEIGPITDTDITAAGRAGIRAAGAATSSTGFHVSNFKAGNGGGGFMALTGVASSTALGSLAPGNAPVLAGVAGTLSPGLLGVSVDKTLSGAESAAAVGTLTPSLTVTVSGVQLAGSVGTVTASQAGSDITLALAGVSAVASVGTMRADRDLPLNGLASALDAGNLSPALSVTLSGQETTAAAGLLAPAIDGSLTGVSASGLVNAPGVSVTVSVTGNQATGALGTLSTDNSVIAAISGVQATADVGTLTIDRTTGIGGVESVASLGAFGISKGGSAQLGGVESTASIGNLSPEIIAALSGNEAIGAAGLLTASRVVNLAGVFASIEIGALSVSVSVGLQGVGAVGQSGSLGLALAKLRTIQSARSGEALLTGAGHAIVASSTTDARVRHER